jgi:hypothetical protein
MFINIQNGKALDVSGANDKEGQAVQVHGKHGQTNQRWNIIYLDKAKPVPTKGFSEEFGFHINRPFYIVSRLPLRRVIESHGAAHARINRYVKGKTQQQFFFDNVSKTIRSQHWKNYCMEIQANGSQLPLRFTSNI